MVYFDNVTFFMINNLLKIFLWNIISRYPFFVLLKDELYSLYSLGLKISNWTYSLSGLWSSLINLPKTIQIYIFTNIWEMFSYLLFRWLADHQNNVHTTLNEKVNKAHWLQNLQQYPGSGKPSNWKQNHDRILPEFLKNLPTRIAEIDTEIAGTSISKRKSVHLFYIVGFFAKIKTLRYLVRENIHNTAPNLYIPYATAPKTRHYSLCFKF